MLDTDLSSNCIMGYTFSMSEIRSVMEGTFRQKLHFVIDLI